MSLPPAIESINLPERQTHDDSHMMSLPGGSLDKILSVTITATKPEAERA
jgi:hypothetical protein